VSHANLTQVLDVQPHATAVRGAPMTTGALTGIRFVAAMMVVLSHLPPPSLGVIPAGVYTFIGELGGSGVTVFFVLSGFLIAYRYYGRLTGPGQLRDYAVNRFARIYPLFALVTIASLAYQHESNVGNWVLSLTFLNGFSDGPVRYAALTQGWTLTVEVCFYLAAPIILALLLRGTRPILIWIALLAIGTLLVGLNGMVLHVDAITSWKFMYYGTFFGRSLEFLVGAMLAIKVLDGWTLPTGRIPWTYAGIVAFVAAMVFSAVLVSDSYRFGIYHPAGLAMNNLVLPFVIAAVFAGLLFERTLVARTLMTRSAILLGGASYALYIIHFGAIGSLIAEKTTGWIPNTHPIGRYVVLIPVLLVLSIALFRLVEEPIRFSLRRRLSTPR
jgi:peptidoglycan/LPS O-acetylase OafA/YrhL